MTNAPPSAPTLSPATVLVHAPHCTVRAQREQHLVYNSRTDELHLIAPTGIYVYELCDGLATVGDIEAALVCAMGREPDEVGPALTRFLATLIERGILAIDGAPEGSGSTQQQER